MKGSFTIHVTVFLDDTEFNWPDLCATYPELAQWLWVNMEPQQHKVPIEREPQQQRASSVFRGVQGQILKLISRKEGASLQELMKKVKTRDKKTVWNAVYLLRKKGVQIENRKGHYKVVF